MHPRTIGANREKAIRSITSSVEALATLSGAGASFTDDLPGNVNRDPRVRELVILERIAEALSGLVEANSEPRVNEATTAEFVLANVEGLSKTSQAAIKAWGGI